MENKLNAFSRTAYSIHNSLIELGGLASAIFAIARLFVTMISSFTFNVWAVTELYYVRGLKDDPPLSKQAID